MVRRPQFLRAVRLAGTGMGLVGVLCAVVALGPAPTAAAHQPAPAATASGSRVVPTPARESEPLSIEIAHLSPSYVPSRGTVDVRGTVTNRTGEPWSSITVYPFFGSDQAVMTKPSELVAAMAAPTDAYVGPIIDVGTQGRIASLKAGETVSFEVRVPADALVTNGGGVYWFGVRAFGESPSRPLDSVADGRARTFLPYVPKRVNSPVKVALVLPLIHALRYRGDGSIDSEEKWTRSLSSGGRLRQLLAFVTAADVSMPVSWLVDPALIDGVAQLAAGNAPLTLGPSERPQDSGTAPGATATPSGGPAATDGSGTSSNQSDASSTPSTPSAAAAAEWLDALAPAFAGNEVLALPYGNIDVPAAVEHEPKLLDVSLAQRSQVLGDLDIDPTPAISGPGGFLDPASIAATDPDTVALVSDNLLSAPGPSIADLDGHPLIITSSGAAQGSPGPGTSVDAIGLRQRILAEAALRALTSTKPPLTVMLPTEWGLDSATDFFGGLDVSWLELSTVSGLRNSEVSEPLTVDDIDYPRQQRRRQLDPTTFDAVNDLVAAGDTLQRVLGDNNEIAGIITEKALSSLGYSSRRDQASARATVAGARGWIDRQLGEVQISASPGVTLASDSGTFVVTLSNDLDQTVTVSVRAVTDPGLTVIDPEPVRLAPGSRTNVLLEAHATSNKVHNVTLMVTDARGVPLGPSDQLPIRSAQVSDVIWLIMGSGIGLLFLAIAIRLVRRIRAARPRASLEAT